MRKMEFTAGTAPADAARAFAKDVHARWGVGDAACNNGVLLLLAIEDRQVYMSTGTGGQVYSLCVHRHSWAGRQTCAAGRPPADRPLAWRLRGRLESCAATPPVPNRRCHEGAAGRQD